MYVNTGSQWPPPYSLSTVGAAQLGQGLIIDLDVWESYAIN